jgi:hypothetical protein
MPTINAFKGNPRAPAEALAHNARHAESAKDAAIDSALPRLATLALSVPKRRNARRQWVVLRVANNGPAEATAEARAFFQTAPAAVCFFQDGAPQN